MEQGGHRGTSNYSEDFTLDAFAQLTERGCSVSEVSKRLGVRAHSLYTYWKKCSTLSETDNTDQTA
ncbi:MAG: transposase [Rhodobacteraceae bacterium]|nr:transposase [Paracoccaceae bacterium]